MKRSDVNEWIRKNSKTLTDREVADALKAQGVSVTPGAVRQRRIRMNLIKGQEWGWEKQRAEAYQYKDENEGFRGELLTFLRGKRGHKILSIEALSEHFDKSIKTVREAMEVLKKEGHNIHQVSEGIEITRDIPVSFPTKIPVEKGRRVKFGLVSDNHLGSKYERNEVLETLFDVYANEGIDTVYQCGNIIEGEAVFNKFDVLAHGIEGQSRYLAEHWPKRKGIKTLFITGDDHEGWYVQREGVNIGRILEMEARRVGREDLVFLGHMEHDIIFEGTKRKVVMRLIHAGGGSSYATSYSAQKIVESYTSGEKPDILLIGHYHKAEYTYAREVHVVQAGTTQDQTPFMRKKKLHAHVGGWIIEFEMTKEGSMSRFKTEWLPFYDRKYYEQWGYKFS